MPRASRRMPHSGGVSASSASAIRLLVVGSDPGKRDAGRLADEAASAVASDEILRPQRAAVAQLDIDAGVVLRETRHFDAAIDRHPELVDPAGEDPLDVVLPQPEPVGVAGGKAADVEMDPGKPGGLRLLPLGEEPIGDAALIEDLEGARMQTARARADELLAGAPLDDGDVDSRQRQLARQHQPRRTASGNHHRMLGHRKTPRCDICVQQTSAERTASWSEIQSVLCCSELLS